MGSTVFFSKILSSALLLLTKGIPISKRNNRRKKHDRLFISSWAHMEFWVLVNEPKKHYQKMAQLSTSDEVESSAVCLLLSS
jgi:hypothetical protein